MQVMDSGLALDSWGCRRKAGRPMIALVTASICSMNQGDTYINDGKSRRNSGSIALDWEITPDLLWQADALLGKHIAHRWLLGV